VTYDDEDKDLDKWLANQPAPDLGTSTAAADRPQSGQWARVLQSLDGGGRQATPPPEHDGTKGIWLSALDLLLNKGRNIGGIMQQDAADYRGDVDQWAKHNNPVNQFDNEIRRGNLDARNRELALQERALQARLGKGVGGSAATPWAEANRIVTGAAPPDPEEQRAAQAERAQVGTFEAPPASAALDQPSPDDVERVPDFVAPDAMPKPGKAPRGASGPAAPVAASGDDLVRIPGTDIADPAAARMALSNPTTRRQLEDVVGQYSNADKALQRMIEIRKSKGIENMSSPERAEYDMLQKQVASAYSKLGSTGVLSKEEFERYAKEMPGLGFGDDKIGNTERIVAGLVGKEYDPTLDKLTGTRKATLSAIENALGSRGLKYGNPAPPAAAEAPPPPPGAWAPKDVQVRKPVGYAPGEPGDLGSPQAVDASDWKKRYERFKTGGQL
jgi:hypothetical protein